MSDPLPKHDSDGSIIQGGGRTDYSELGDDLWFYFPTKENCTRKNAQEKLHRENCTWKIAT